MPSLNKVMLIGGLGKDPEVKFMPNGDAVCSVSIATSQAWRDKQTGEKKEATEWHNVVFFRRLAEIVGQYLQKGSQIYIEGRLRTRKWQAQDGTDRYTTEIVADEMQMLGGNKRDEGAQQRQQPQQRQQAPQQPAYDDFGDTDIPF